MTKKKSTKKGALDQVWQAPKPTGRFHSEGSPPLPEVKEKGDDGPTPIRPKPASVPILEPDLLHSILDKMLRGEVDGSEKLVEPDVLLGHIFPPRALPASPQEVYDALEKRVLRLNPSYTTKNWWRLWIKSLEELASLQTAAGVHDADISTTFADDGLEDPNEELFDDSDDSDDSDYMEDSEVEDLNRPLTREERVCFVYQSICDAAAEEFPGLNRYARTWTGYFSTKALVSDASRIVRKPDMANLKSHIPIPDFKNGGERTKWRHVNVIGEDKLTPKTDGYFMRKIATEIYNKGFCVMENQLNRRLVHSICNTGYITRVSTMDRGGVVHTKGFNMKTKPVLFLHALLGLTFASDEYIGYDPAIEVDEQNRPIRITVGTRTYTITSVVWHTPMIRGRATTCFLATRNGKEYIIKDYWIVDNREPTEVFFMREAAAANVPFVPTLYDWEDVIVNGRLDTSDNNRGVYKPLLNRKHRRMVFSDPAVPIYKFASKRELISALRDAVIAHQKLCEAGILHRDISLYNLMIQLEKHPTGLRKGMLIDFDYAYDKWPHLRLNGTKVTSPEVWPRNLRGTESPPPERALTPPELELQKAIVEEFEEELRIRGHRTGTHPFMAHEILSNKHTPHTEVHDLESFFYVLIYLCVMFLGPHGYQKSEGSLPEFLYNWLYSNTEHGLGRDKSGLINYKTEDFQKNVGRHFSRYMSDLLPCVMKMKNALKYKELKEVTHQTWLDILNETLEDLPQNERLYLPVGEKFITGVKTTTRSANRHAMEKGVNYPAYFSADPNVMRTHPLSADQSFEVISENDKMDADDDDKTVVQYSNDFTLKRGDEAATVFSDEKNTDEKGKGREKIERDDLSSRFSFLSIDPNDSEGGFSLISETASLAYPITPRKQRPTTASSVISSPDMGTTMLKDDWDSASISTDMSSKGTKGKGKPSKNMLNDINAKNGPRYVFSPSDDISDGALAAGSAVNMTIQSTGPAGAKDLSVEATAQSGSTSLTVATSVQNMDGTGSRRLSLSSTTEARTIEDGAEPGPDLANVTTRNIISGPRTRNRIETTGNTVSNETHSLRKTSSLKPRGRAPSRLGRVTTNNAKAETPGPNILSVPPQDTQKTGPSNVGGTSRPRRGASDTKAPGSGKSNPSALPPKTQDAGPSNVRNSSRPRRGVSDSSNTKTPVPSKPILSVPPPNAQKGGPSNVRGASSARGPETGQDERGRPIRIVKTRNAAAGGSSVSSKAPSATKRPGKESPGAN